MNLSPAQHAALSYYAAATFTTDAPPDAAIAQELVGLGLLRHAFVGFMPTPAGDAALLPEPAELDPVLVVLGYTTVHGGTAELCKLRNVLQGRFSVWYPGGNPSNPEVIRGIAIEELSWGSIEWTDLIGREFSHTGWIYRLPARKAA